MNGSFFLKHLKILLDLIDKYLFLYVYDNLSKNMCDKHNLFNLITVQFHLEADVRDD